MVAPAKLNFYLFQKKGEGKPFTEEEQKEWDRVVQRYHDVCSLAKQKDVEVLIDAEESWMQDAADELAEEMMKTYNTEVPVVYNTLQTYRHDRLEFLKASHKRAKEQGFMLGYKISMSQSSEIQIILFLIVNASEPIFFRSASSSRDPWFVILIFQSYCFIL